MKHYGYEFKYGINDVDAEQPLEEGIPQECNKVLQRALKTGHVKYLPDQLTVNKYNPGQGKTNIILGNLDIIMGEMRQI